MKACFSRERQKKHVVRNRLDRARFSEMLGTLGLSLTLGERL